MTAKFYFGPNANYADVITHPTDNANAAIQLVPSVHVAPAAGSVGIDVYISNLTNDMIASSYEIYLYYDFVAMPPPSAKATQLIPLPWTSPAPTGGSIVPPPPNWGGGNCAGKIHYDWIPPAGSPIIGHNFWIIAELRCNETQQVPTQPSLAKDPCVALLKASLFPG